MQSQGWLLAALVVSFALGSSTLAHAQVRDAVAAEALFREGREAFKRGDYAAACPKLRESQRLDPAPGTLLNVAQCDEKQGMPATAWQHYREVLDSLKREDPRYTVAQQGVDSLSLRVPKLKISLASDAPLNTIVTRDSVELAAASLGVALPYDPGTHTVTVTCPGRKPRKYEVVITEAKELSLTVSPGDAEDAQPERAVDPAPVRPVTRSQLDFTTGSDAQRPSNSSMGSLPYVLGAVGIVGIGAGSFFALRAKSQDTRALDYCAGSTCWDQRGVDLTNEGRDSAKISAISFLAGGVSLLGAVVLVLVAPSEGSGRGSRVQAVAAPNSLSLQAGGHW